MTDQTMGPESSQDMPASFRPTGFPQLDHPGVFEELPTASRPTFSTRFGGLYYLLNVFTYLGLYADFTRPQVQTLSCSPWTLLRQLGQHWWPEAFSADLLCAWLDVQAGPLADEPFTEPAEWLPPDRWLTAFPPDLECGYLWGQGRLHVRHPAGFCLADVQAVDVSQGLELVRSRYPSLSFRAADSGAANSEAAQGSWLTWLAEYLDTRLRLSLGAQGLSLLVCQPAQIEAGDDTITVVFALDTHPLDIRLSGLDRDPGWIPATGLSIHFRYET